MKRHQSISLTVFTVAIALSALPLSGNAQDADPKSFSPEQIQGGSKTYETTCAPCHGVHMADPEGAFDLRKFPRDQKERFVRSVSNGKNSMPPWRGLLSPGDIDNLWAYVVAGEKN